MKSPDPAPRPSPTPEQETILAASTRGGNLAINALAGTGKSTTLQMIDEVAKTRPVLYLTFSAKGAEDASKRFLSTTTVRSFNSFGHRVWASTRGNITLNKDKTRDILRTIIDEVPKKDQGPLWDSYWPVIHGVAMAKAVGYLPEGKFTNVTRLISQSAFHAKLEEEPDDLVADLIDLCLQRSITAGLAGTVDFNDQPYLPAMFGGVFPRFPTVLVDERQDLNPVNHALLARAVKGQIIMVGDEAQCIYGFRGAVQDGCRVLDQRFLTAPLDLSVSFRCPRAIVEAARWRVPNFKWCKEGGHVDTLTTLDPATIPDGATFLCRNNAPLFALAFRLLSAGRSVRVAGSDIGPKLVATMRRLGSSDLSRSATLGAIAEWQAEREAKGNSGAADMADAMRVFANHGSSLAAAIAYAEHLFKQNGTLGLMTGHKAKGLEWPVVYHLDPQLLRQDQQDLNLRYVIQTRSMDRYYEVASQDIRW